MEHACPEPPSRVGAMEGAEVDVPLGVKAGFFWLSVVLLGAVVWWKASGWAGAGEANSKAGVPAAAVRPPSKRLRIPKVGHLFPKVSFRGTSGRLVSVDRFRGRWVLVNFWATWCEGCKSELPSMRDLVRTRSRLVLLKIAVDREWSQVRRFMADNSRLFPRGRQAFHLHDPGGKVARGLGTDKYPESYLISPQGVLAHYFVGPQRWLSAQVLGRFSRVR